MCPEPVPVTVDAHQIQRALVELLLGAAALAPHGSVKLCTSPGRNTVAVARILAEPVEQHLPADLFEPFGDSHVSGGLMLPLSKRLINNQDGRVNVQRHDNRLEFVVELPASNAPLVAVGTLPISAAGP